MASSPATLLIVDDEPQVRKLLETLLQHEGYQTLTASSGEEALQLVAQQPPDLILLDIMMPGMDGYEVASQLKGNAATANIPIIMLTALSESEARISGLKPVPKSSSASRWSTSSYGCGCATCCGSRPMVIN